MPVRDAQVYIRINKARLVEQLHYHRRYLPVIQRSTQPVAVSRFTGQILASSRETIFGCLGKEDRSMFDGLMVRREKAQRRAASGTTTTTTISQEMFGPLQHDILLHTR